jgi:two-component system sensor histidine kinase/response regulator
MVGRSIAGGAAQVSDLKKLLPEFNKATRFPGMHVRLSRDADSLTGHNPVVLFALIAIVVLGVISQVALRKIHLRQQQLVQSHLESSLNSLSTLLSTWQQQHVASIQVIASTSRIRGAVHRVLEERGEDPISVRELEKLLLPLMPPLGYDGYSVFTADRLLIAATSRAYVGLPARLPQTIEVMDRALAGHPAISRPMLADRPISGPRGDRPAGVLFQMMCVTLDGHTEARDQVVAPAGYFCIRFDPHRAFFPIFASVISGNTGESYAVDHQGNIITPSRFPQHLALLGLNPQSVLPAVVPDTEEGFTLAVRKLLRREPLTAGAVYPDYRGVTVVGATRWLEEMNIGLVSEQDYSEAFAPYIAARDVILALSLTGTLLLVLLCITSVLNRRALAQRETRFRSLLENIPTPIYMKSLDGRITVLNSAFCQLVRASRAELQRAPSPAPLIPDWLAPVFEGDLCTDQPFEAYTKTLELTDPGGQVCYYRVVRFPVLTHSSDWPQAMASVIINDTERVQAERQLEEINTQLEKLVEERTRELWHAKEAAVAASKTKAEFLANMSHEIRTPLNAVLGLTHLSLAEPVPPRVHTYLEKIQASGRHLLQVINDILDFSRIEAGKMVLDERPFQLTQLLDSVVNLLWERAESKGLSLTVSRAPDVPDQLLGDPLRLGQILINFTANAVKFTERGQVVLSVRKLEDQRLEFAVEDTGIGIGPEQITTLFQPFHQVDSSSRRRFQGSGLGLTISRNLAELMGGTVAVTSTPGVGSRFCLQVKLCETLEGAQDAARTQPQIPLRVTGKVLVVEDDNLNREITESLVRACGAEVTTLGDGQSALDLLEKQHFDLVLMDIQMPGMDGLETSAHIRARPHLGSLPIVAVTANALAGDRERYMTGGMNDYLSKPLEPQQLQRILARWLPGVSQPSADIPTPSEGGFHSLKEAGVDIERALEYLLGNSVLYQRLLERFVRERGDLAERLNQTLQDSDMEKLRELVHGLKSVAATLGLTQLAQMAAETESFMEHNPTPPPLEELTIQFRQDLTLVRAWVEQTAAV